jgi:hypothetical protein
VQAVAVLDEEFFKGHAQKIRKLAEGADPFIKKRLLQLAKKYERPTSEPSHAPTNLLGLEVKMSAERDH